MDAQTEAKAWARTLPFPEVSRLFWRQVYPKPHEQRSPRERELAARYYAGSDEDRKRAKR
jgi:hypothetical protein